MDIIKIKSYDGEYPNLCSGKLIVEIDGKEWVFPGHCMVSGGAVWLSDDWSEEYVEEGPWEISDWPDGFPEEYKKAVLEKVNSEIEWGCCGGCI